MCELSIFCIFMWLVSGAASSQYVVLIDSGSSGSRVHVHSYKMENSFPVVSPSQNLKQKPGLSSYAQTPAKAAESLRELKLFAQKIVPREEWDSTPLLLQATAGLRALSASESDAILEVVRDELSTWGFKFRREWARVISGSEEGINGFIAANYLKGVLKPGLKQEDTFGVLEMGGASMQITFCADGVESMTSEQRKVLTPVTLAGTTLQVYTQSYLGYGQEKAAELVRASNLQDDDPCVLTGSAAKAKGDFDQCGARIKKVLFGVEHCSSCSFTGDFQPNIKGEIFLAIENFFYTPKFFGAHEARNFVELLQDEGKKWCNTPFHRAMASFPELSKEELNKFCFGSAYAPLLLDELGFTKQDLETAVFVSKNINGSGIDWALGGVITFLTGAQPVELPVLSSSASSLFSLRLLLLGIAASFVCLWFKKRAHRSKLRSQLGKFLPV